ncbi:MAG: hypothetical protein MR927_05095, partial [Campylobacter sp.]|nr:hypothetical protein [Campylobacter sp.]
LVLRDTYGARVATRDGAVCVESMGLFREVKRLDIFLNTVFGIHKTQPNTHFLLVGSGDTGGFVRDFISMHEMGEFVTLFALSLQKCLVLWIFLC